MDLTRTCSQSQSQKMYKQVIIKNFEHTNIFTSKINQLFLFHERNDERLSELQKINENVSTDLHHEMRITNSKMEEKFDLLSLSTERKISHLEIKIQDIYGVIQKTLQKTLKKEKQILLELVINKIKENQNQSSQIQENQNENLQTSYFNPFNNSLNIRENSFGKDSEQKQKNNNKSQQKKRKLNKSKTALHPFKNTNWFEKISLKSRFQGKVSLKDKNLRKVYQSKNYQKIEQIDQKSQTQDKIIKHLQTLEFKIQQIQKILNNLTLRQQKNQNIRFKNQLQRFVAQTQKKFNQIKLFPNSQRKPMQKQNFKSNKSSSNFIQPIIRHSSNVSFQVNDITPNTRYSEHLNKGVTQKSNFWKRQVKKENNILEKCNLKSGNLQAGKKWQRKAQNASNQNNLKIPKKVMKITDFH